MPGTKAYSTLEVAKHSSRESCWMIIEGKVYDTTSFLDLHPGGDDIMIDASGRDATREFEDVGHSGDARAQLEDMFIGEVRQPTEEELARAEQEAKERGETLPSGGEKSSLAATLAKWLFPVILVGVAYILRKYTSPSSSS